MVDPDFVLENAPEDPVRQMQQLVEANEDIAGVGQEDSTGELVSPR